MNGLIQPKDDSPFELDNPSDLLTFSKQDERWDEIIELYHELVKGKKWLKAYEEEYLLYRPTRGQDVDVPDCKKISSLTFSMFSFEHLEGMRHRENLTSNPDRVLPSIISPIMTVDQFGHWLCSILKKNSSSWLHYNMASMYWRARGIIPKAIECSRRAVHYAPREFKDIPLLNLGSLLHRSKKTEDAITVIGAAVDHNEKYYANHFILATAYAVLGDYNNSLRHLDIVKKLDPRMGFANRYRYGILCHAALLLRLNSLRDIAQRLKDELYDLSMKESQWVKLYSTFLVTMKNYDTENDFRNVIRNAKEMSKLTGLDMLTLKKKGDRYAVIQYFLEGSVSIGEKLQHNGVHALDSAYSLQRLVKHVEKHAVMAENYEMPDVNRNEDGHAYEDKTSSSDDSFETFVYPDLKSDFSDSVPKHKPVKEKKSQPDKLYSEYFVGTFLYPSTMKVNRNSEDFDTENAWPTNKFCKEKAPIFPPKLEMVYPVFLPFENKGISIYKLLSEKIGVPVRTEHELPWYPPSCPHERMLRGSHKRSQSE
ncbi:hypothetical protein ACJJTC_007054 [Scirpophaga incertulas]